MPTYEYQCTKCGRVFEVFQSIKAKPKRTIATDCQRCNNRAPVRRLIGCGAGVIFKGAGFYETDYRSESYKAGEKAAKEAVSGKDSSKEGAKDGTAGKVAGSAKPSTPAKRTGSKKALAETSD